MLGLLNLLRRIRDDDEDRRVGVVCLLVDIDLVLHVALQGATLCELELDEALVEPLRDLEVDRTATVVDFAIDVEPGLLKQEPEEQLNILLAGEALAFALIEQTPAALVLDVVLESLHGVAASHNAVLLDLFDSFTPRLREAMVEMLRIRREFGDDADHDAHAAQVDAIVDRDEGAAAARSRAHLLTLRDALA
ncbi:MAG: FCD domain-containing protein [Microbacterium sp.]|nr:FCD domain-containing protein [Microbacterium sp.]MCV0375358.1 FCD domain-containing protein [Microbacterium sp.]MCV0388123.1 FCD domain-containing protein [Microbacterium sp.]MCV0416650.1 FCD domain-containing protein [Microbacterium sp.]MCV0423263.1 FCD domain-containing protein [Microbacterium sp.]